MNAQQEHLKHVDGTIGGQTVQLNALRIRMETAPADHKEINEATAAKMQREIDRLTVARADIVSKLTEDEIAEYNHSLKRVLTDAEQRREREEATRLMNENKDRPSH